MVLFKCHCVPLYKKIRRCGPTDLVILIYLITLKVTYKICCCLVFICKFHNCCELV